MTSERKRTLKKWVIDIGYKKAFANLKKEHDTLFNNLGDNKTGEYSLKKEKRLTEIVEAINHIELLQKVMGDNFDIF